MRYTYSHKIIAILLFCLGLAGCDPYHGFGCVASERHPSVAYARSLSKEQLESAYIQIQKLSNLHAKKEYETLIRKSEIPEDLRFLKAEFIRVSRLGTLNVTLANCFDERIILTLSSSDSLESTITLSWAEPTNENPYAIGSEVLWQRNNEL